MKRAWLALVAAPLAMAAMPPPSGHADKLAFHYDRERSGWNDREGLLTPAAVAGDRFGPLWKSPPLDSFGSVPPRLFASPLYLASVTIDSGVAAGHQVAAAFAVTTTGFAYAISTAAGTRPAPGTILWRSRLTDKPCDGGTAGNLSTPVIDPGSHRLYVTSCDDDRKWQLHALDIRNGREFAGWPVALDAATLNRPGLNRNGSHEFSATRTIIQRGALNLSPDNKRIYVPIGPDSVGWLVVVDADTARVASAFSSTASTAEDQGGMWASGGPSVDRSGRVYIATGSKFLARARKGVAGIYPDSEHDWGQSLLQFRDDRTAGLNLLSTYSPFNFCQAGSADIDLGSSGTVVLDLPEDHSATPHLLMVGGKQGNLYLLDREHLGGGIVKRHACSTEPDTDTSLLAPEPQPQFGLRGPINLFGPYSDYVSMLDQAKSRSTPAYYRDKEGRLFVFATGSTKTGDDFSTSVPPGLARVAIKASAGQSAYLRVAALEKTLALQNPGSPIVSSNGGRDAIVWVLDTNAPRSAPLYGQHPPHAMLYAFDAETLRPLWKSGAGALNTSGKYNEAAVVDGLVLVGTDRLEAFGLRAKAAGGAASAPTRRSKPPIAGERPVARVSASAPNPAPATGPDLFRSRCAGCHASSQPGTPSRADLARLSPAQIADILTNGIMRPMAAGLTPADVAKLAAFLSARTKP